MATFVVYKRKFGFVLIDQSYSNNKTTRVAVPKDEWGLHGFSKDMTVEQARSRAKLLNRINNIETREKLGAARRVKEEKLYHDKYLPEYLVQEFEERLKEATFKSEKSRKKEHSYWLYTMKLIRATKVEPVHYADRKNAIYSYFVEVCASPSTVEKTLALLNRWGTFVCKQRKQFYEMVPSPQGEARETIANAYQESESYQGKADRLTPEMLEEAKIKNAPFYNWLLISIWFGLRPAEIDRLRTRPDYHKIENDHLYVYQPKLIRLPKAQRWKAIPIKYPEQKRALSLLNEHKQPYYKWFEATWPKMYIRPYSGRNNFTDMMLDLGNAFEDVSLWMGHASVVRTYASYKERIKKKVS